MRIRTLALLLSTLIGVSMSSAQTLVSADDPLFRIMGRVIVEDGRAHMGFPGIKIRFAYEGAAPTLSMTGNSPNCYFDLSCNGWGPVTMRLEEGPNEILLPTGEAPEGGWVVDLVRRTENWMGTASFDGLLLPEDSNLIASPSWPERKLMFIGDSTTCGEFNERVPPIEEVSAATTNVARSYGMILADRLNAQVHLVAYGGQGIIRDWSGKTEGENVALAPDYFELSMPRVDDNMWDHNAYVPDVIVVNLGTDFDAGTLDEAEYIEVYGGFIRQIRVAYPAAHIIMCESNFLSDEPGSEELDHRNQLWDTMNAVADEGRAAGDARLSVARAGYYPGTPADTHLTVFQHEQLADELIGPIRKVAGWQ